MTTFLSDGSVPDEGIFTAPAPEPELEGEEVDEALGTVVTEALARVDPESIAGRSPKRYIQVLLGAGWEVETATSRTFTTQPDFKTGARAGEARPDLDVQHLWLCARLGDVAWLMAHFKGGSFDDAKVWDAAGWPTELWYDYQPIAVRPGKDRAGRVVETPDSFERRQRAAERDAANRNAEYNDGTFWVNKSTRILRRATDFEEWLADLIPGFEPRKKSKKRQQTEATAEELIEIGEWVG